MSDDKTIYFNDKNLKQILKALTGPFPKARVGILGTQGTVREDGLTNAEIGAAHEYGTSKLPMRSFLREPISTKLKIYLKDADAFNDDALKQIATSGSLNLFMKKIGHLCETIVSGAFDTGGFGKWPKWKDPGYQNNTGQVLVDTQQLRNSISSEVIE